MSAAPSFVAVAEALAMAGLGLLLGLAYFAILLSTVALFRSGGGWLRPLALTLARLGAMIAWLVAIARFGGAAALLAGFAGFLVARQLALRAARRAA